MMCAITHSEPGDADRVLYGSEDVFTKSTWGSNLAILGIKDRTDFNLDILFQFRNSTVLHHH